MKLRYFGLFALLFAFQGCSSTTIPDPTAFDFTQANAQYLGNVSDIYGVTTLSSLPWYGPDIKWKDALGNVHALSDYQGKVILLSFWNYDTTAAYAEEPTLDSVQMDMNAVSDSVVLISVASYNHSESFLAIDSFIVAHKFNHQEVVDSTQRAQVIYAGSNQLGYPETFALKPNGNVLDNQFLAGWYSRTYIDSLVREAYK